MIELSKAELVAFVATIDTARARAFYEGVLGRTVDDLDATVDVLTAR